MGKKSAAKSHANTSSSTTSPERPKRGVTPLLVIALVVAAAAIGAFVFTKSDAAQSSAAMQAPPNAVPPAARFGPHKRAEFPPLPVQAYAPPRPPEVVRAAYTFAAEHPEILSYVPCFCGCERGGHKGNDDCFVARRAENGDVVEWEPHGLDCAVCIDVATYAKTLHASGASLADIRNAVEQRWAGAAAHGTHTPTPLPPKS
jgi:Histone deacetylase complex, SIN3 component